MSVATAPISVLIASRDSILSFMKDYDPLDSEEMVMRTQTECTCADEVFDDGFTSTGCEFSVHRCICQYGGPQGQIKCKANADDHKCSCNQGDPEMCNLQEGGKHQHLCCCKTWFTGCRSQKHG